MLKLVNPIRNAGPYFRLAFITGVPALLSIVGEMVRNSVIRGKYGKAYSDHGTEGAHRHGPMYQEKECRLLCL